MNERIRFQPKPSGAEHIGAGVLQRKCACSSRKSGGECEECKKKRTTLHRRAAARQEPTVVPPVVYDVLNSPGQPLNIPTRTLFENRFGHDFGRVRVHADGRAAESAQAVNALAYTVGSDIVFGQGQYSPSTGQGRMLLAHELTHVIQQHSSEKPSAATGVTIAAPDSRSEMEADRYAVSAARDLDRDDGSGTAGAARPHGAESLQNTAVQLARTWNDCGAASDCPPRQKGEAARAAASGLQVGTLDAPEVGEIVSHFNIGSSSVRDLSENPTWKSFVAVIAAEDSRWEILGFSDCEGSTELNVDLRRRRAEAVLHLLPPAARSKIDHGVAAPLSDCVAMNYVEWDRALNRSVVFRRTSESVTFAPESISAAPPRFVCGPDVSSQVAAAVASIGTSFGGWSPDEKSEACDALDSSRTGGYAWDIVELHNNAWILNFRPVCASEAATPHCGSSVQVSGDCYYAGSVNYVIFGKMCKLCADYYLSIPLINTGYARFTKSSMRSLISLYKGKGFSGFATPSANFGESIAWAEAGYDGWPSGATPPPGDRANCTPMCPTPYSGPSFRVNWYPRQFYTGGGAR